MCTIHKHYPTISYFRHFIITVFRNRINQFLITGSFCLWTSSSYRWFCLERGVYKRFTFSLVIFDIQLQKKHIEKQIQVYYFGCNYRWVADYLNSFVVWFLTSLMVPFIGVFLWMTTRFTFGCYSRFFDNYHIILTCWTILNNKRS